jgi:hypothetical protein
MISNHKMSRHQVDVLDKNTGRELTMCFAIDKSNANIPTTQQIVSHVLGHNNFEILSTADLTTVVHILVDKHIFSLN